MGLDIYHDKPTLEPEDKSDFVDIAEWAEYCDLPLDTFQKFITDIEDYDYIHDILIFENEQEYQKFSMHEKRHNWYDDYLISDDENEINHFVKQHAKKNGIVHLKPFGVSCCTGTKNVKYQYDIFSYQQPKMIKGIYFNSVGHQRKGMDYEFYDHFKALPYAAFGHRESFEFAYQCIQAPNEYWTQQLKEDFKKNFLDNYKQGESLLVTSF